MLAVRKIAVSSVKVCKGLAQCDTECCLSVRLEGPRQRWEDTTEMDGEVSPHNVEWTRLVQDVGQWRNIKCSI